jgi:hypothetical protein
VPKSRLAGSIEIGFRVPKLSEIGLDAEPALMEGVPTIRILYKCPRCGRREAVLPVHGTLNPLSPYANRVRNYVTESCKAPIFKES